jgi:hypothetical protein
LKKLRRILRYYDVWEDPSKGNGSHTTFCRRIGGAVFSYPLPAHSAEIQDSYVKLLRRRLKLLPADNVPDDEFFGRA